MSRLRIVCTRPPQSAQPANYPSVMILPSLQDVRVVAIDDDGEETELEGVTAIRWEVSGRDTPIAHLEIHGVEIDAEAIVQLAGK